MTGRLTLTFDNGPTPGVTEGVLDALRERDLPATFFVVGSWLDSPGIRELAERVHAEGHWLGNHTYTHGVPLGRRGDRAVEVGEIALTQESLGDLAHPDKFFRPNGAGSVGHHLLSQDAADYLAENGFTVVMWDLYVRDPHEPDLWADRALARLDEREWNVLVTHDVPTGAMDHLPRFLDTVLDAGIEIVQELPEHATPLLRGQPTAALNDIVTTA
ncbi:polysaccharide deacetylase family protein [Gordonia amarae]|uniref:Polysaccharide deacetylase family protein n=2 Tax=Gordonia amarae TaxID=36821 RepID=A0A857L2Z1_9ACTN|nr:polysaccharide deacetylase family protein [Gordonia amarae]MCS3876546.1 peptidoglycan/xylan/chitin deacetylase (PgdA/CDA1 family) [Gordonia amarae]QHN19446.1 polysaccharide deacetylase family protein [Gordonia amarae]QHN23922.1 polysaccharide deacetylase family protein [Gordonia amarae]QHN32832.1 polysaccharide deacetylase family protein [Gordonia amarae]QHN41551.1 polysaccharide deacetylase family protein [Gordonia amarae]